MPIYEYRCENDHVFEVMQRMTDDTLEKCSTCNAPVQRVFHPVAVHFKGSGFYSTDYGKGGAAKTSENGGSEKSSESKSSDSGSDSGSSESKSSESKSSDTKSGDSGSKSSDSGSKSSAASSASTD
ncbi:MAG: FmdB family transcriptional regulator [Thermoleophilaceae bacterium]|nr:FmdB family transcriptional regulator [Thermoleophilaceae bacterium]